MGEPKDDTFLTSREILRDIHSKTNEMYVEVMGNPNVGRLGYGQRIKNIEDLDLPKVSETVDVHAKVIDQYKTDRIKVMAWSCAVVTILLGVWELVKFIYG